MSSSYLPEKVFAVCTHNTNGNYGKLLKNPGERNKYTVLFKSKDKPLLTEADKKLDGQFSCKTNWSSGIGTAAFGGGIMVGLGIAATVATIPGAGWLVGGVIAAGCLAWGLISFLRKPSCSDMIGYKESEWINPHSSVTFDEFPAVTKQSMIACKEGGMLLPFISESAASAAAGEIASNNRWEVGVNIGASFLAGVLSGWAAGSVGGAAVGTGRFAGTKAAGKEVLEFTAYGLACAIPIGMALSWEKGELREHYDNNNGENPIYDEITQDKKEDTNINPFSSDPPFIDIPMPNKPTKEILLNHTDLESGDVVDAWNPKGFTDKIKGIRKGLYEKRRAEIRQGASERRIATLNSQIADIDRALKRAEVTRSFAGKKNPYGKKVLKDIQRGAYGPEAQRIFSNRSENGKKNKRVKGAKRERLYRDVRNERTQVLNGHQNDLQEHKDKQKKGENRIRANAGLGAMGNLPALSAPFISTWLSEKTLNIAAKAAMEDMANGITIAAREH